jgi:hypothetical protein
MVAAVCAAGILLSPGGSTPVSAEEPGLYQQGQFFVSSFERNIEENTFLTPIPPPNTSNPIPIHLLAGRFVQRTCEFGLISDVSDSVLLRRQGKFPTPSFQPTCAL